MIVPAGASRLIGGGTTPKPVPSAFINRGDVPEPVDLTS
jgi:hypothetical protein